MAEYPTPEAVARRCAAGLVSGHENDKHDEPHGNGEEKVIQHGSPLRVRWECWGWLEWLQEHTLPPLKDFQYY